MTGRPWRPLTAFLTTVLALTACGGAPERPAGPAGEQVTAPAPPAFAITPSDGATGVRPDQGVTVTAAPGTTLQRVEVRAGGAAVPGVLARDRRTWRSRWALRPGTAHTVTATGADAAGAPVTVTGGFTTLKPATTFAVADVTPRPGELVGVGMPLIVTFDRPITDRAAVERALEVRMSRRVPAAWNWTGPRQVVLRPRRFWPPGQRLAFVAHTAGVRAAPGVYGAADTEGGFRVGAARVSVVDTRRHRMAVRVNGRVVRTAPISAGKGGTRAYTTTSGVHLVMGKGDPVVMSSAWMGVTNVHDPRYYKLKVRHAVQISASGEYVHSAPWSLKQQGRANISHGCVNASPAFAQWFYGQTLRGDVVTVIGTDRPLEVGNGWGYWQLPWSRWVAGSALKRPLAR
ncbi:L,D-transpeptidase [Actinomadura macrotermitis]|uniref:L,D-transpeptidase 2 n=1 Tax=Actinomadura macrotermitis TaxID=2585200 RepID=A0A7K0C3U5_9ACTN|nr:Ig-like domain-containing protein [Actinomadura macrotermitis]MQY08119.1 L,D-transpeptidase 2 [Actinomadura macrotermitis]